MSLYLLGVIFLVFSFICTIAAIFYTLFPYTFEEPQKIIFQDNSVRHRKAISLKNYAISLSIFSGIVFLFLVILDIINMFVVNNIFASVIIFLSALFFSVSLLFIFSFLIVALFIYVFHYERNPYKHPYVIIYPVWIEFLFICFSHKSIQDFSKSRRLKYDNSFNAIEEQINP